MTLIKGVRGEDCRGEFLRETFLKKERKKKKNHPPLHLFFPVDIPLPPSPSPSLISLTKFLCAITTLIIIIIVTTLRCYIFTLRQRYNSLSRRERFY